MGFMGELAVAIAGSAKGVKRISCQFKAMTFIGDEIEVGGKVQKLIEVEGEKRLLCQIITKKQDGTITCQGEAEITIEGP